MGLRGLVGAPMGGPVEKNGAALGPHASPVGPVGPPWGPDGAQWGPMGPISGGFAVPRGTPNPLEMGFIATREVI